MPNETLAPADKLADEIAVASGFCCHDCMVTGKGTAKAPCHTCNEENDSMNASHFLNPSTSCTPAPQMGFICEADCCEDCDYPSVVVLSADGDLPGEDILSGNFDFISISMLQALVEQNNAFAPTLKITNYTSPAQSIVPAGPAADLSFIPVMTAPVTSTVIFGVQLEYGSQQNSGTDWEARLRNTVGDPWLLSDGTPVPRDITVKLKGDRGRSGRIYLLWGQAIAGANRTTTVAAQSSATRSVTIGPVPPGYTVTPRWLTPGSLAMLNFVATVRAMNKGVTHGLK